MIIGVVKYLAIMRLIEEKSNIKWENGNGLLDRREIISVSFAYITDNNELSLLNLYDLHGEYEILNTKEFCDLCEKRCPKKLAFTKENVKDELQYCLDNIKDFDNADGFISMFD